MVMRWDYLRGAHNNKASINISRYVFIHAAYYCEYSTGFTMFTIHNYSKYPHIGNNNTYNGKVTVG